MKIKREKLLSSLSEASIGLSKKEILEQSHCFVFHEGKLITFNDEIFSSSESPLDEDAIVSAEDLLKLLAKMPDEEIDVAIKGDEIVLTGKRRSAGVVCAAELCLPFEAVPAPGKWSKLPKEFHKFLQQAARTCGQDETQYKTTCVHVTPKMIEACDNYRLFRAEFTTGTKEEVLIPATAVAALHNLALEKISVGEGWVHFTTGTGQVVSLRCSHETYHEGLETLLEVEGEELTLPKNLAEIIERAEVMNTTGYDSQVHISIENGQLEILSQKDGGWFREKKRVSYKGQPLSFNVNPQFMSEVLARTHQVTVADTKLKLEADGVQFVVTLEIPQET